MTELTHFDDAGKARMVDVGPKPITHRSARASACVKMLPETLKLIRDGGHKKGDVLAVARLAGISAAKKTGDLILLCHPLPLDSATVDFEYLDDETIRVEARVSCTGRTGVEMEALTAASIAALTVYDMCKSVDRAMTIEQVRLEEKDGGASGRFSRDAAT